MSLIAALPSAVCSGIAYAVVGLLYKSAERHQCRPQAFTIAFMVGGAIITGVATYFDTTTWGHPLLWTMGISWGIITYITINLITYANRLGPATISWTMLNLSLVIPILLAPVLFHDHFLPTDAILMPAFVLMLWAFARSMDGLDEVSLHKTGLYLLLVVGILLLDGLATLGTKFKDVWFGSVNNAALPAITFVTGLMCAFIAYRFKEKHIPVQSAEWRIGGAAGVACGIGAVLLLGSMHLPPIVSLPIVKGLALAGGVTMCVIVYRERLNLARGIGLSLSLVVLAMAIIHKALTPH